MKESIKSVIQLLINASGLEVRTKENKRYHGENLIKVKAICYVVYKIYGNQSICLLSELLNLDRTGIKYFHIAEIDGIYDFERDVLKTTIDFYKEIRNYILMFKSIMNSNNKDLFNSLLEKYKRDNDKRMLMKWLRSQVQDISYIYNITLINDRLYAIIDEKNKEKCKELLNEYGVKCLIYA